VKQFTVIDSHSSELNGDFRSTGLHRRYVDELFQLGANAVVLTLVTALQSQEYFVVFA